MKLKFITHFVILFIFYTHYIKPTPNYDIATIVHTMLKDLKTVKHAKHNEYKTVQLSLDWLEQSLKRLQSDNDKTTPRKFIKRQQYLAQKITALSQK